MFTLNFPYVCFEFRTKKSVERFKARRLNINSCTCGTRGNPPVNDYNEILYTLIEPLVIVFV